MLTGYDTIPCAFLTHEPRHAKTCLRACADQPALQWIIQNVRNKSKMSWLYFAHALDDLNVRRCFLAWRGQHNCVDDDCVDWLKSGRTGKADTKLVFYVISYWLTCRDSHDMVLLDQLRIARGKTTHLTLGNNNDTDKLAQSLSCTRVHSAYIFILMRILCAYCSDLEWESPHCLPICIRAVSYAKLYCWLEVNRFSLKQEAGMISDLVAVLDLITAQTPVNALSSNFSVYNCLCWAFTAQSTRWGHVQRGQFT